MKQKKSSKTLIILLIIIIVLIGALEIFERCRNSKTTDNLTNVNIKKITRIALSNEKASRYISLKKEETGWFVTAEKVVIPIEDSSIKPILEMLKTLAPEKIVASDKDEWEKWGVEDEQALRVTVYNKKEILADFFIGKTEKEKNDLLSFIRIENQDDVFSVKGNIRKQFEQDFFKLVFPK